MPKENGLRDDDMRMRQLKHVQFMIETEINALQKQLSEVLVAQVMFPHSLEDEVEFSKVVDGWIDCPRLDSDEHPTMIMETGNSKKIPYFFTEYKRIYNHSPYPQRMTGYNWEVQQAVAEKCERPLLYIEYCWDEDEDGKYATYYIEAVNQFAKDKFDKITYKKDQTLPYRVALDEYQLVRLSFIMRDKENKLSLVVANKHKFSQKKNVNKDFWKGI